MYNVKIKRLPLYDYSSDGYYFVTIVSRLRLPLFSGQEKIIEQIFYGVADSLPGVTVDTMVVMPNHVHCIITLEQSNMILGEVVRRMKAKTSYTLGQSCWQSNYYEHVIRTENALGNIREYILFNPQAEEIKLEEAHKWARHRKKSQQIQKVSTQ